jgi:hypothetical protein
MWPRDDWGLEARRHLDALVILAVGTVVAIAPMAWSRWAWSDPTWAGGWGTWVWMFIPSVAPFVLLAVIRRNEGAISRPAAALAL